MDNTIQTNRAKLYVGLAAAAVLIVGTLAFIFAPSRASTTPTPPPAPARPEQPVASNPSPQADPAAPRLIDPAKIDEILESASLYRRQNQIPEAMTVLTGAIGQYPQEQRLYLALGDLLMSQNQPKEAYEVYEKVLAIGPREAAYEFTAGTLANTIGRTDRALEHYAAAQTADPSNPDYPLYLGLIQLKLDKLTEADVSLRRSTMLRDSDIAWGTMAEIALRQNNLDIAQNHITKARSLNPDSLPWRVLEARLRNRQGKPEETIALLSPLTPPQSHELAVLRLLGDAYGMQNKPAQAFDLFDKAAVAKPDDGSIALDAAMWAQRAGKLESARTHAQSAVRLNQRGAEDFLKNLPAPSTTAAAPEDPSK